MATDGAVVIVGVGMMTAVGLTAMETAASVRARTMRFAETDFRDKRFDPFTLAEVPDDGLPALAEELEAMTGLTARERRMLRLAAMPLRECVAPLAARGSLPPLSLSLALPEAETTKPLDGAAFLQHLATQVGYAFDAKPSDASHTGRAGGLLAVGQAVATIRSGGGEFVLAGGVDSYRDLYVLGTLDMEERVKSAANWDAFIPGEGAGFLLLASPGAAAARGLTPLARVSPVAMGFEPGHLYSPEPYRGDGLAAALAQLGTLGTLGEPVGEVYSSMNGESHWAKEWGVGYLRNRGTFDSAYGIHHPADSFGDTGAACGPLMVGLAALGIKRTYRPTPAVVYGSSDHGPRAAVAVSAA